jgi:hypothetical protein
MRKPRALHSTMLFTARLLTLLAVIFLAGACSRFAPLTPTPLPPRAGDPLPPDALQPSPNRLVGRVLAVDLPNGFVIVDLAGDPPAAALADGAELIVRTDDLHETARLRVSRYLRGRTLGTTLVSGRPSPREEVVWHAP